MARNFLIRLAGKTVDVTPLCAETEAFCHGYLTQGPADFSVRIDPEDIAREREKAERSEHLEGIPHREYSDAYLETLAIYRRIAEEMVDYDTILFHGSVIAVDGEGYLFAAKSGTGKSTHARLWREMLGDRAFMVNDDKPLLTISDCGVTAYGTPWDGKHHLSRNTGVPLKALCLLERAEENRIQRLEDEQLHAAFAKIYQQTYRSTDPGRMKKTLQLLDILMHRIPIYRLCCNMDPEAARVAYEGMNRRENNNEN